MTDTCTNYYEITQDDTWESVALAHNIPVNILRAYNQDIIQRLQVHFGRDELQYINNSSFDLCIPSYQSNDHVEIDEDGTIHQHDTTNWPSWDLIGNHSISNQIVGYQNGEYTVRIGDTLQRLAPSQIITQYNIRNETIEDIIVRLEIQTRPSAPLNVPVHIMQTTEDLLRYMWYEVWQEDHVFNIEAAQVRFSIELIDNHESNNILSQDYIDAYSYLRAYENDQELPFDGLEHYRNLAVDSWLWNDFGAGIPIEEGTSADQAQMFVFDQLARLVQETGLFPGVDRVPTTLEEVRAFIIRQLGDDYSPQDLAILAYEVSSHIHETENIDPISLYTSENLLSISEGYLQGHQLDVIRQAVFDPNWNPHLEGDNLIALSGEIDKMPNAIMDVSINHVKTSLAIYKNYMQDRHERLLYLREMLLASEQELLVASGEIGQDTTGDILRESFTMAFTFASLAAIPYSLYSETFDAALSVTDFLVSRDPLSLLGILPLIPNYADEATQVVRYFDELPAWQHWDISTAVPATQIGPGYHYFDEVMALRATDFAGTSLANVSNHNIATLTYTTIDGETHTLWAISGQQQLTNERWRQIFRNSGRDLVPYRSRDDFITTVAVNGEEIPISSYVLDQSSNIVRWDRIDDTEPQLLEEFAMRLELNPNLRNQIIQVDLYTERVPCESCGGYVLDGINTSRFSLSGEARGVIQQYAQLFSQYDIPISVYYSSP